MPSDSSGASFEALVRGCALSIFESTLGSPAAFVRVGAHLATANPNDPFVRMTGARTNDSHFRTVLVEPQPKVYARLLELLAAGPAARKQGTVVENAATCASDTHVTLYTMPSVDPQTGQSARSPATQGRGCR